MSGPTSFCPSRPPRCRPPVVGGVLSGPLFRAHPRPVRLSAESVVLLVWGQRAGPPGGIQRAQVELYTAGSATGAGGLLCRHHVARSGYFRFAHIDG